MVTKKKKKKEIHTSRIVEIVVPQNFLVSSKFTRKIPCFEQRVDQNQTKKYYIVPFFLPTSMNKGKSQ